MKHGCVSGLECRCVWSERRESHKEQNKAFKLLNLFLSKEIELFKKEKKKRNRT